MDHTPFIQLATLIGVFAIALASPGPDFVVAVRNSIIHSRRAGVMTALGFAFGVLVHVTYTVFGIGALIASSLLIFNLIKWAGAAYLVYLGVQALRSKGMAGSAIDQSLTESTAGETRQVLSDGAAIRSGFLTNALNPKATLFFVAIFSQIISPETPLLWQAVYGLTCFLMTFVWFSVVALILNQRKIREVFLRSTKWIDRVCGTCLVALGIKVALTHR